ncbi:hypothetical protein F6R97_27220 [Pseudomonas sp. JV414]|nr:recombinase family protein [Pseudomonas sp. JV414]MDT9678207.1 hypothetical protein [Pseudomonas sp. JV414]
MAFLSCFAYPSTSCRGHLEDAQEQPERFVNIFNLTENYHFQPTADRLNSKGLRSPRGSEFTPTAVRSLMLAFNVSF